MTELTVRPAVSDDVPALHELVHGAYRGDSARRGWTHEADLLDGNRVDVQTLAAIVADPPQVVLLAERDGGLVGCVQVTDKGRGLAANGFQHPSGCASRWVIASSASGCMGSSSWRARRSGPPQGRARRHWSAGR